MRTKAIEPRESYIHNETKNIVGRRQLLELKKVKQNFRVSKRKVSKEKKVVTVFRRKKTKSEALNYHLIKKRRVKKDSSS